MNKKIIWIVVAVVIVALAAFFLLKGNSSQNTNNVAAGAANASPQANANVSAATEQTSLKALLASGKSQKCTFQETDAGVTSQGTVYVGSGKMRGDFSANVQGKTQLSHMVVDNQTSYVWMDGIKTGFKMKTDASAQANANANTQAQSVDPNKNMSFHCDNSSADDSMFKLPSDVEFSDMTSLTTPGAGANAQAEAACAVLSEPARTQCMAAIKTK